MQGRIRLLVLGILPALFLLSGCDNRQWLDDKQGYLSKPASEQLNTQNRHLLEDHDIDYRLVIQAAEGDINQRARRLFQDSGAGQRSQTGRGLLLLLDPQQNEVRLEVSTALEGVYTDAFVSYLERQQMVPFFRHNRVADGIAATTELIIERARQAKANQAFQAPKQPAFSAGGGARVPALIGEGAQKAQKAPDEHDDVSTASTPEQAVQRYLAAMAAHNDRADLSIYTHNTRDMLADWVVTPAQMDNLASSYQQCGPAQTLLGPSRRGPLAVIRYPIEQRQCAPWLLRIEEQQWRLDLASQQTLIRFGRNNQWHLDHQQRNPWFFGFMDWQFDRNGFPLRTIQHRWALSVTSRGDDTFVRWVGEGAAADQLGLRYADQLLSWNGTQITDHRQVAQLMGTSDPGSSVRITILRDGQTLELTGQVPPRLQ
ncbi:MAG: TPM domain-containing protein [Alcanivorax sp.]|uniref:TPM domain-containing protein n=1 Tax=Alcanivorax sp. TaxID=1872427 RepID=UPI003DA77FE9